MAMRTSVLYYPHIEIRDTNWLKTALLLWDNVYRIVPPSYSPLDSEETKIAADADLVRAVKLEQADLQGIVSEFQQFLLSLPFIPDGLEPDGPGDLLHPEKVDAILYPLLEQYASGNTKDGWIELPREIVRGYMFYLSAKVAERRKLVRCTENKHAFSLAAYFSEDANFSSYVYDRSATGFYSSLIFDDVLPVDVSQISMNEVLRVAISTRDERVEFRTHLERFTTGLRECESKDHADTVLNDYKTELIAAKNRLKRAQGFLGVHDRGSLLTMGVPVAMTAFGTIVGAGADPFGMHALSSSLLIGAMAAYQDFRKSTTASSNPHGASYLISLEREFRGTGNYPAFHQYFEEFIND